MSQATYFPTTTAPRRVCDALHAVRAIDAVHHAQRGVTALLLIACSQHACDSNAVNFVADGIAEQLKRAEAELGRANDNATGENASAAAEECAAPASRPARAGVYLPEGPSVASLFQTWQAARAALVATDDNDAAKIESHCRQSRMAEDALVVTPSTTGYEVRYKLEVLSEMLDHGEPVEPRRRVMLASIAGDVANLLG